MLTLIQIVQVQKERMQFGNHYATYNPLMLPPNFDINIIRHYDLFFVVKEVPLLIHNRIIYLTIFNALLSIFATKVSV